MATEKVSGLVGRAVEEVGELVARRFRLHRHRPNWRNSHGPLFWSLPYWANILIFVAWFIAALFIIGLIVGFVKERNLAKRTGRKMRWLKVLSWGPYIGFFLWIPIGLFRFIRRKMGRGGNGKERQTRAYKEIDEESQKLTGEKWHASAPPRRTDMDADSRYEPMGYAGRNYDSYAGAGAVSARASPHLGPSAQHSPEIDVTDSRSRANSASGELHKPPPSMPQPPASYTGRDYE